MNNIERMRITAIKTSATTSSLNRRLGIEGKLYLDLWIDKKGTVRQVIVKKPLYPAIDEEARKRAYQLKFSPAMQRDKPVDVWMSFPVIFKLEN